MTVGQVVAVQSAPCVLALDGEREVEVKKDFPVAVGLSAHGPLVIDLEQTMTYAQQHGLMVRND